MAAPAPLFTLDDIKALFRLAQSSPPPSAPPPKCIELTTGAGVITESAARAEIADLVLREQSDSPPRTTTFALATRLSLPARAIDDLLPPAGASPGWGRVGLAVIVTAGEHARLRAALREELGRRVVSAAAFCRTHEIDEALFRGLLPPRDAVGRDGDWVWSTAFWDAQKRRLAAELGAAAAPVALADDAALRRDVKRRMVAQLLREGVLAGAVDGAMFVSARYTEARQHALVDVLTRTGVLALSDLREARVADPRGFLAERVAEATVLDAHAVMPAYTAALSAALADRVRAARWADVADPEGVLTPADMAQLLPALLHDHALRLVAERLIDAALPEDLAAAAAQFARAQAARSSAEPAAALKRAALQQHLAAAFALPPALATHYAGALYGSASGAFAARRDELAAERAGAARAALADRFAARFAAHLRALERVADAALQAKLAADLAGWARAQAEKPAAAAAAAALPAADREALQAALAEPADARRPLPALRALRDALAFAGDAAVAAKTRQLVAEMREQLRRAEDAGLLLLLALVLVDARAGAGVLRASGKFVPKLLKDLKARGLLAEEQAAVLESVKEKVVKGVAVGEEERSAVRKVGLGEGEGLSGEVAPDGAVGEQVKEADEAHQGGAEEAGAEHAGEGAEQADETRESKADD